MRPLFGVHPDMKGGVIFVCLYIFVADAQHVSFSSRPVADPFSNPSRLLTSDWCQRETKNVSPVQKTWDLQLFFQVIFYYCSHSLMTGWPTTNVLAWVNHKSAGYFCRLCLLFRLIFFISLSFPGNYPLVLFITWTYHITLHIYMNINIMKIIPTWPRAILPRFHLNCSAGPHYISIHMNIHIYACI